MSDQLKRPYEDSAANAIQEVLRDWQIQNLEDSEKVDEVTQQITGQEMIIEWGSHGPDCPACATGTDCCGY